MGASPPMRGYAQGKKDAQNKSPRHLTVRGDGSAEGAGDDYSSPPPVEARYMTRHSMAAVPNRPK